MSRINEKMGFKPAGKRSMMKLPPTLKERIKITSACCPECHRYQARPVPRKPGWVFCFFCNHTWELPA